LISQPQNRAITKPTAVTRIPGEEVIDSLDGAVEAKRHQPSFQPTFQFRELSWRKIKDAPLTRLQVLGGQLRGNGIQHRRIAYLIVPSFGPVLVYF
jgi:hypothetical protein